MARAKRSRKNVNDLIDQIEGIREERLAIQTSLEQIESAKQYVPDKSES